MRGTALALALVVLLGAGSVAAGDGAKADHTLETGFTLADQRIVDVTGDGAEDVVLVGHDGQVRVWRYDAEKKSMLPPAGEFILPDPGRCLLAIGDVLGTRGAPQLVVLSEKNVTAHRIAGDGSLDPEGDVLFRLPRRGPFTLRPGAPQFSRIVNDLNGDGCLDVIVPGPEAIRVWLCAHTEESRSYQFAAAVRTDLKATRSFEEKRLSDQLESAFRIPYLDLEDVNGDGRPDLMVVDGQSRAFHLQRDDGSFPEKPDRVLDLTIFQDTSPPASIRPGRTLAGSDDASLMMSDLDNDGMPDYVICHRRKVWTFLGTKDGPNFVRPTQILSTAEDVSAFLVVPLDDDPYPDLLLLRVQVPSVTAIIGGIFTELSVEITATGYSNKTGQAFSKLPDWKNEVEVRLPAISEIIRNPQALMSRFEATASKFRATVEADFDGDGTRDVAMLSEGRDRLDLFRIEKRSAAEADLIGLRRIFFEDEKRVWTLDDILALLGGIAEERTRRLTGGKEPDAGIGLRGSRYELRTFDAADLRGDGKRAIAVIYVDTGARGAAVVDVFEDVLK